MNVHKKWGLITMAFTAALLIAVAMFVYFVDPFLHYRINDASKQYPLRDLDYFNPGLVEHIDYDCLVSGSSMTQNFLPSEFDESMGLRTLLAPCSGATVKNINVITSLALENNPQLKHIYWGLDLYSMETNPTQTRNPLPEYLYDDFLPNDVNYLLNKSVVCDYIGSIDYYQRINTTPSITAANYDHYGDWINVSTVFSEDVFINGFDDYESEPQTQPASYFEKVWMYVKENYTTNIEPIVRENPEVEFTFFYPPYSLQFWYWRMKDGTLHSAIEEITYVTEQLLQYENVRVFTFQNNQDIVCNLYNYKDYNHYHPRINSYMVQAFASGEGELTKDNYVHELDKIMQMTMTFDYSLLQIDINPLKGIKNLYEYLTAVQDSNYTVYAAFYPSSADDIINEYTLLQLKQAGLIPDEITKGTIEPYWGGAAERGRNLSFSMFETQEPALLKINDSSIVFSFESVPTPEIIIGITQYAPRMEGLNIVVYDNTLERVVDNQAFSVASGLSLK